uniref:Uncharacterized protein n=1 Tax=Anguilla anguilla TaxID=7936 RepID=A0A0E9VNE6_ANGAN
MATGSTGRSLGARGGGLDLSLWSSASLRVFLSDTSSAGVRRNFCSL